MINPDEDLIVMYHYVWPDEKRIPGGIRPMLVSQFERQLDWLMERYEVVGGDEFLSDGKKGAAHEVSGFRPTDESPAYFVRGSVDGASPRKPRCLLTFDDATRDHAEVVTPILLERKLSGVFFAIQNPSEGIMPLTHAAHWLLSDDDARVWTFLVDEVGIKNLGAEADSQRIYHYEPAIRARIKYAINFSLDEESVRRVLSKLAHKRGVQIDQLARDWFASTDQLKSMHEAGMTIGVHARTHRSLKVIGGEAMAGEIESCTKWLTNLLGERPKWFACPFGGVGARERDVELMMNAVKANGLGAAVSTVSASVPENADHFALPRVDCIAIQA